MWVPIVENNEIETEGAEYFVKKNVAGILDKDKELDTLILGCTHYPLLATIIRKYIPSGINILNQGQIVAEKLVDYLKRHPEIEQRLSKSGKVEFQTTESSETFENKAALFLDQKITFRVNYSNLFFEIKVEKKNNDFFFFYFLLNFLSRFMLPASMVSPATGPILELAGQSWTIGEVNPFMKSIP